MQSKLKRTSAQVTLEKSCIYPEGGGGGGGGFDSDHREGGYAVDGASCTREVAVPLKVAGGIRG